MKDLNSITIIKYKKLVKNYLKYLKLNYFKII